MGNNVREFGRPNIFFFCDPSAHDFLQKLGSVCSVVLHDLDNNLFSRLKIILSNETTISDSLVQVAALKATTILVQQYVCYCVERSILVLMSAQLPGNRTVYGASPSTLRHLSASGF